jgi:hypothetical protein
LVCGVLRQLSKCQRVEVLCHVAQTRNVVLSDGILKDSAIAESLPFNDSDNDLSLSERDSREDCRNVYKKQKN